MKKKEFVLTKEEFDLGVGMAKRNLAKKIFKEIERIANIVTVADIKGDFVGMEIRKKKYDKLKKKYGV